MYAQSRCSSWTAMTSRMSSQSFRRSQPSRRSRQCSRRRSSFRRRLNRSARISCTRCSSASGNCCRIPARVISQAYSNRRGPASNFSSSGMRRARKTRSRYSSSIRSGVGCMARESEGAPVFDSPRERKIKPRSGAGGFWNRREPRKQRARRETIARAANIQPLSPNSQGTSKLLKWAIVQGAVALTGTLRIVTRSVSEEERVSSLTLRVSMNRCQRFA